MAEWAGAAAILALIAKGASKGDIQTPDEKEKAIKELTLAKATLEQQIRDLELAATSNTVAAKKDFLFEQKQKADNEKRAIAEAEAVWSRATPEVLLKFAQKRLEEPVVEPVVEPAVEPPPAVTDTVEVAAEPPPAVTDTVEVAAEPPPATDTSTVADETADELAVDGATAPTVKGDVPKELEQAGGAVAPVSKVYQDLADSSMARAYVVRGSLVGLYEKVKKAMVANKLPPPEKIPFLEAAKNDLIAAAETLAGVKESGRAKVRADAAATAAAKEADRAKVRADAAAAAAAKKDERARTVEANTALSKSESAHSKLKDALEKLVKLVMAGLNGRACLGDVACAKASDEAQRLMATTNDVRLRLMHRGTDIKDALKGFTKETLVPATVSLNEATLEAEELTKTILAKLPDYQKLVRMYPDDGLPAPAPVAPVAPTTPGTYFEPQEGLGCGRHALNNLFGEKLFVKGTPTDKTAGDKPPYSMRGLCEETEARLTALGATVEKCQDKEDYDINTLVSALTKNGYTTADIGKDKVADAETDVSDKTYGFVVNLGKAAGGNNHWVALRLIERAPNMYLVLDSLKSKPVAPTTWADFIKTAEVQGILRVDRQLSMIDDLEETVGKIPDTAPETLKRPTQAEVDAETEPTPIPDTTKISYGIHPSKGSRKKTFRTRRGVNKRKDVGGTRRRKNRANRAHTNSR